MTTTTQKPTTTTAAVPASTDTYQAGFARLAAIAERLKTGSGTSIDCLVADVRTARTLHRQLKQRLDAVRRELEADEAENHDGAS